MHTNTVTIRFYGQPKNNTEAQHIKRALIQNLEPLFPVDRNTKIKSETSHLSSDVRLIRINYKGAPIPHTTLHYAFDGVVKAASDRITIGEIHTTILGTRALPDERYVERDSYCEINFEPPPTRSYP